MSLITNETIDIYIITSIIVNTKTTTTDILKLTLLLLSTTDGNMFLIYKTITLDRFAFG